MILKNQMKRTDRMKKTMVLAVLFGALVLVGNSFADPIPIHVGQLVLVDRNLPVTDYSGGPFTVSGPVSPTTGQSFNFYSFCIEKDEYLSLGSTYYVGDISHNVIYGGVDNPNPTQTTLSYITAKLYSDWLNLSDKNNGALNSAYQRAIWYAEKEIASIDGEALNLYTAASGANEYYGVYALNLVTKNAAGVVQNQSLLVKDPVPEPVSMLLFGSGLVAAGGYIRRRMKK